MCLATLLLENTYETKQSHQHLPLVILVLRTAGNLSDWRKRKEPTNPQLTWVVFPDKNPTCSHKASRTSSPQWPLPLLHRSYYTVNCAPQNSCAGVWTPILQNGTIYEDSPYRDNKVQWGHEGGPQSNMTSALTREEICTYTPRENDVKEEIAIYLHAEEKDLRKNVTANTMRSGF